MKLRVILLIALTAAPALAADATLSPQALWIDQQVECHEYAGIAVIALSYWQLGYSRASVPVKDGMSAAEIARVDRALDDAYITIASILARNGVREKIEAEPFRTAMYDTCIEISQGR